jgi:hypothetical protein
VLDTRFVSKAEALTRGIAFNSAEFKAAGGAFYGRWTP